MEKYISVWINIKYHLSATTKCTSLSGGNRKGYDDNLIAASPTT